MTAKLGALDLARAAALRANSPFPAPEEFETGTVSRSDVVASAQPTATNKAGNPPQIVPPPGLSLVGEATVSLINEALRSRLLSDETLGRFSREALDSKNPTELVLVVYVARAASHRTIWSTPARQLLVRNLTIALGRLGQAAPPVTRPHTDLLGFPQRDLTFVDVAHKFATAGGSTAELERVAKAIESVDGLRAAFDATCRLIEMGRVGRSDQARLFGALYRCQAKLVAKLGSNATVIPLAGAGPLTGFVLGQAPRPIGFARSDIEVVLSAIAKTPVALVPPAKALMLGLARSFLFDTKDVTLFSQTLEEKQANDGKKPEMMRRTPTPIDEL